LVFYKNYFIFLFLKPKKEMPFYGISFKAFSYLKVPTLEPFCRGFDWCVGCGSWGK